MILKMNYNDNFLTFNGVQLDAYLIILFGNIAIPRVLDSIHLI